MGIKNGTRVFAGNFILVWKHLLFLLFTFLVSLSVFMLAATSVYNLLKTSGWVASVTDMLESVYASPNEFAANFSSVATNLFFILKNNFSALWPSYLLCILVVLLLPSFLLNIGQYALGAVLYNRTKSLLNKSYFLTTVGTLSRSVVYALIKMAIGVPFVIILLCIGYGYGVLANNWLNATLLLPILIMLIILVLAIKHTFLIGFLPEAVSENGSVGAAFGRALLEYTKDFGRKLLHYFALFIVEFCLVLFISLFSVGVGLLIAFPSVCVLNAACSFCVYYAHKKENFYAGEGIIIKPIIQQ